MSENKPEELNSQAVPFFARFLEGQSFEDLSDQESEGIGGGSCGVTNKHKDELRETRKYPSDKDDVVTEKYPYDSDEQVFTTLKFPSDSEEHVAAIK
ncbi:microviridin/marinostatin family tricyclic proteinase inhibitor [uncultured Nostoc sp.]|uniref:microviridin/marinostatin family tricyclic proteinase inhibitor n=1 Tax=uncultured Nostoc sp. TaxID=340711 RepID=UPI00260FC995|nr:microviridin/marinostatin family tricyclic proteinase inhibitor [uncultured Nostoc sp.]